MPSLSTAVPLWHRCLFLLIVVGVSSILSSEGFTPAASASHRRPARRWVAVDATPDSSGGIPEGIRLNKVFRETHSRRQADKLIASGRVSVNGVTVTKGFPVVPFQDKIALDGALVEGWEAMNAISKPSSAQQSSDPRESSPPVAFEYLKYWKPLGVTCTTDRRIPGNIIDALHESGFRSPQRVFPVGRLDKSSTGLILLTSDGRLPNAALRGRHKLPKVYHVSVDRDLHMADVRSLRDGVVITTTAQRDRGRKTYTAPTLPCRVDVLNRRKVQMTLVEGRNRQIRKMMGALGYTVTQLHRVQFLDLTLGALRGPGDVARLAPPEEAHIQQVIADGNTEDDAVEQPRQQQQQQQQQGESNGVEGW